MPTMEPAAWSKLHGAVTHFPIALMFVSAFCEGVSLLAGRAEWQRAFRAAGAITIVLGAMGSYLAVASGLIMTKGQIWGHGTMLRHHQFVWPAFALMTGLASWRVAKLRRTAQRPGPTYLGLMFIAAGLMGGVGYWGGELLNRG